MLPGEGPASPVTSPDTSPGIAVPPEGTAVCQGLSLPRWTDSCVPRRAKPSQSEKKNTRDKTHPKTVQKKATMTRVKIKTQ